MLAVRAENRAFGVVEDSEALDDLPLDRISGLCQRKLMEAAVPMTPASSKENARDFPFMFPISSDLIL